MDVLGPEVPMPTQIPVYCYEHMKGYTLQHR